MTFWSRPSTRHVHRQSGAASVAISGLLCALTAWPAPVGAAVAAPQRISRKGPRADTPLTPRQKALHALRRFSFGPRPGDLDAVERTGVDAWFQQQLHPEAIDDSDLNRRLQQFPAMQLTQAELIQRFPTPEMLRRYNRGQQLVPEDTLERAIYADAARSYEERKQNRLEMKQAGAVVSSNSSPTGMQTAQAMSAGANDRMAPAALSDAARDAILSLPPAARMQRLLALSPDEMWSLQAGLRAPDQARLLSGLTPEQAEEVTAMKTPERMVDAEVLATRLLRDVYSRRQLQAVMTDFWLNHFSVYLRKNQNEPYLLPAYEREAILPHALGRFEDLLIATAQSPAMLVYLDNWQSVGPNSAASLRAQARRGSAAPAKGPQGINENYARELMELHTLGVKGGYTQRDVIEVARCFTGWTIDRPAEGGEFLFNPNRHEPGDKVVLGHTIHEGGVNEGLQVLHLLATSPSTAHFVSLKLAQRFVSDAPPPALVDRMTAAYLRSDGDIKVVLTTLFRSPEFWGPQVYRAKVKTPLEFVASALRATDADVLRPMPLVQAMDRLGMPIYGMQTPNGYSWLAEDWVSSNALLTRMNFALVLAGNRLQGTHVDWPALVSEDPGAAGMPDAAVEDRLERALLNEPAAPQTRAAALNQGTPDLVAQAEQTFRAVPVHAGERSDAAGGNMLRIKATPGGGNGGVPATALATAAGLVLGSPDFQRR